MIENNKSSNDIQEQFQKQGTQISKYTKHGIHTTKNAISRIKNSAEVGKNAISSIFHALSGFKLPSILILLLIIVLLICLLIPVALQNTKDGDTNIYSDENTFNSMMMKAIEATKDAITSAYEDTISKIHDSISRLIHEKYEDDNDYISVNYNMDDVSTTATNITGYIQAVNAVLINYLPEEEDGIHTGGLDTENDLNIKEENEYNSLGDKYKEVVADYAENDLFQFDLKENITKKNIKVLKVDSENVPILDEDGKRQYESKTVNTGTISVDVKYNIANYKKEDINRAAKLYYEEMDGNIDKAETCKSLLKDAINDMLYILTGSRTIPSAHSYTNPQWDMLMGVGDTSQKGNILHFDGVTSEGWTFPTPERVGKTAGTWAYEGSNYEHLGVDLAVPNGTPLLAMANGIILCAADGDYATGSITSTSSGSGGSIGGGNEIMLLVAVQDKLFAIKYCHMTAGLLVKTGQEVKAGDILGYSGATGCVTGPHCHIEITWVGIADQFDAYATSWNGDWSNGAGWQGNNRKCSETVSVPCRIRPETVMGLE